MGELLDALKGRGPEPGFIGSPEAGNRFEGSDVDPYSYVAFLEEARLAVRRSVDSGDSTIEGRE